jgi:Rrf2 family iron-sulfur cluster assembly transcriptional regulator
VRLNSKTAYGVQALYDMAFHGDGRAVQARELSERQGIPLRYLEQILQELRRAGLVAAKRGPGGGYALSRAPEDVCLAEVVEALDGPLDTLLSGEAPAGDGAQVIGGVGRELADQLAGLLSGITLRHLVARAEALGLSRAGASAPMYFI